MSYNYIIYKKTAAFEKKSQMRLFLSCVLGTRNNLVVKVHYRLGCDGAEETVLSAGGLEETDDTGSAELTAELVLSTTDDTLGCDEMVLLSVCALFGVFCSPLSAMPRK